MESFRSTTSRPLGVFVCRYCFFFFSRASKLKFNWYRYIVLAILLPIFGNPGNVVVAWRVTSKLRSSMLIQVARRFSKVIQRFSASLVRVGDVQGVP